MSKTSKYLVAILLVLVLVASNIGTLIITTSKYIDYTEMLEKENLRLTDENWILNFRLQAENTPNG